GSPISAPPLKSESSQLYDSSQQRARHSDSVRLSRWSKIRGPLHFEDCMENVACWADRVKIVWWDGGGICLFAKTLEKEQFCRPRIAPATVRLNYAQLLALVDGMDWKKVRPITVQRPQSVGSKKAVTF